jgi:hypothetical protein
MKLRLALVCFFLVYSAAVAQRPLGLPQAVPEPGPMDDISSNVAKIANSIEGLKKNWGEFFKSFSTNQGLQLTERQQKILLALEVLNRCEQRIANLQKMRIEQTEKLASLKLSYARNADDLLPETIERYVALRGTTDAENLRDLRRGALQKERTELSNLIYRVQTDLDRTNSDIDQTDLFTRNIRAKLFPEIDRELSDL